TFAVVPGVTSFTHTSAPSGAVVTITGTGFSGVTSVSFAGFASPNVRPVSTTSVKATVPASVVTSGKVMVSTPSGTGTSATNFNVLPAINSISPTSGTAGSSVTLTGTTFVNVTAVKFAGVTATFTLLSSTSIKASVPNGAISGPISVTTAAGSGFSQSFD